MWSEEDNTWVVVFDFNESIDFTSISNNGALGSSGIFTDDVTTGKTTADSRFVPTASGSIVYGTTGSGSSAQWVEANGGSNTVVISDDAPSSPNAGDLWWESDTGRLKVYYNDGDSAQWVDTASGITDQINATGGGKFVSDSIGINTVSSVGLGTTAKSGYQLYVEGNARVTGVLTVGQASLTLDGDNNIVNVGTRTNITLGHTQGVQFHTQNLHASGFEVNNINASGIVTATKIDAPIEGALNTTGVVTATGGIQGIGIFSGGTSITAGVVTSLNFTGDELLLINYSY